MELGGWFGVARQSARFIVLILLLNSAYLFATDLSVTLILPIHHQALEEIARGFTETATQGRLRVKVVNAQGDEAAMRAILLQNTLAGTDILAPIGTTASRLAAKILKDKGSIKQKLLSLAVDQNLSLALKEGTYQVLDGIPITKHAEMIKKALGKPKKIAVIYSPDERIVADIKELEKAAAVHGFIVQKILVHTQQEIYTSGKAIHSDAQALFVLKDHMVVAGIRSLRKIADQRKMLLIASDEGSVIDGADFALGVSESQIGIAGAKVALQLSRGEKPTPLVSLAEDAQVMARPDFEQQHPSVVKALSKAGFGIRKIGGKK